MALPPAAAGARASPFCCCLSSWPPARATTVPIVFDSPPLHGVEADRPYRLTLELSAGGEVLQTLERDFSSNVSQAALPEKPLTVGPGYARNPESR